MAANRGQPECFRIVLMRVLIEARKDHEVRSAIRSLPDPFASGISQMKSARDFDASVKALEDRENCLDLVANARIVLQQPLPGHDRFGAEGGPRHGRNNPRLRTQVRACRNEYAS